MRNKFPTHGHPDYLCMLHGYLLGLGGPLVQPGALYKQPLMPLMGWAGSG